MASCTEGQVFLQPCTTKSKLLSHTVSRIYKKSNAFWEILPLCFPFVCTHQLPAAWLHPYRHFPGTVCYFHCYGMENLNLTQRLLLFKHCTTQAGRVWLQLQTRALGFENRSQTLYMQPTSWLKNSNYCLQNLCRSCAASQGYIFIEKSHCIEENLTITEVLNKHGDKEQGQLAKFRAWIQTSSPYIADYVYFRTIVASRKRYFHR